MNTTRDGLVVVISGPSGTGKGTIYKLLENSNPNVRFSVSATTRQPRKGEVEGISYFFKSTDEFKRMIENDDLIEWDLYCDNYYGTPVKYIEDVTAKGYDIILDITVEGAVNIKRKFPDSVLIFLLPPSFDELKRRIAGRGTETEEAIDKRLEAARKEITYIDMFDYAVVNYEAEKAVQDINNILDAEKHKINRNKDILKQLGMWNGRLKHD